MYTLFLLAHLFFRVGLIYVYSFPCALICAVLFIIQGSVQLAQLSQLGKKLPTLGKELARKINNSTVNEKRNEANAPFST
jgi:hypothetical protein